MAKNPLEWPTGEDVVYPWLAQQTDHYVCTETPSNLEDHLPAYRVNQVGGSDQSRNSQSKTLQVEVTVYAADRGALKTSITTLQTLMAALENSASAGWFVDEVTETFAAQIEPFDGHSVRQATATYGIAVRPRLSN